MASHQKKAKEEERTIVWVDEAGFYLLPMAVRTWAPRGQTPALRVPLRRAVMIAISVSPTQERAGETGKESLNEHAGAMASERKRSRDV